MEIKIKQIDAFTDMPFGGNHEGNKIAKGRIGNEDHGFDRRNKLGIIN